MKIIKFIPWAKTPLLPPTRASIPQWWKDGELHYGETPGESHPGLKACVPFMEVMMSGYVVVTPFDLYVTKGEQGETSIRWNAPDENEWKNFIGERSAHLGATIPRPAGHEPNGFVWSTQWSWKTPRGYSTLVTHPFNRFDLPFTTMSGIIDTDKFYGNGNIPFFIKKDFVGTIPAGTPYVQLFPFKRDTWKSWSNNILNDKIFQEQVQPLRTDEGSYKKRFWVRKEYR